MQRGFSPFARVWRAKCRFSLFSQSNKSGSTMSLKFFTIPIQDLASSEGELNSFMANHRVLSVERHFVDHGASSFWSVCVDFLDGQPATSSDSRSRRAKVDYRDLRKEISQEEGVPVYTVFTNEQLAQMVQRRVNSQADLAEIEGVGEARVEKYASRMLEILKQQWKQPNEAGEQLVPADRAMEAAYHDGQLEEAELQRRVTAMAAFTRTPTLRSWKFRQAVLQRS